MNKPKCPNEMEHQLVASVGILWSRKLYALDPSTGRVTVQTVQPPDVLSSLIRIVLSSTPLILWNVPIRSLLSNDDAYRIENFTKIWVFNWPTDLDCYWSQHNSPTTQCLVLIPLNLFYYQYIICLSCREENSLIIYNRACWASTSTEARTSWKKNLLERNRERWGFLSSSQTHS